MLTSSHCLLQSSAASLILFTWRLVPASESTEAVYSVNFSRDDLVSSVSFRYSTNFVHTLSFGTPFNNKMFHSLKHNVAHVNALICPEMKNSSTLPHRFTFAWSQFLWFAVGSFTPVLQAANEKRAVWVWCSTVSHASLSAGYTSFKLFPFIHFINTLSPVTSSWLEDTQTPSYTIMTTCTQTHTTSVLQKLSRSCACVYTAIQCVSSGLSPITGPWIKKKREGESAFFLSPWQPLSWSLFLCNQSDDCLAVLPHPG